MKELRRQGTDLKMRILSGIYGFIPKFVEDSLITETVYIWYFRSLNEIYQPNKSEFSENIMVRWIDW